MLDNYLCTDVTILVELYEANMVMIDYFEVESGGMKLIFCPTTKLLVNCMYNNK